MKEGDDGVGLSVLGGGGGVCVCVCVCVCVEGGGAGGGILNRINSRYSV